MSTEHLAFKACKCDRRNTASIAVSSRLHQQHGTSKGVAAAASPAAASSEQHPTRPLQALLRFNTSSLVRGSQRARHACGAWPRGSIVVVARHGIYFLSYSERGKCNAWLSSSCIKNALGTAAAWSGISLLESSFRLTHVAFVAIFVGFSPFFLHSKC